MPEGTPAPKFNHDVRGEPRRIFTYRDVEGATLGYVCQFLRSAGGVQNITRTWCQNEDDKTFAWRWNQFQKLRPLYGADRLDPDRLRIVLIVADEWTAEELTPKYDHEGILQNPGHPFTAFDIVSWSGGRSKLGEVDYSPLKGRICSIWLPHSAQRYKVAKGDPQSGNFLSLEKQPWRVAARQLQETLRAFGAVPVSIVEAETTEELVDGWDPIQAMNMGWDLKRLFDWMQGHFSTAAELAEAQRLASGTQKAPGKVDGLWDATLLRKEGTGPLLAELHNVRMILSHHEAWRDVIWHDQFAHRVMKSKPPPFQGATAGEWSDFDDSMSTDWLSSKCGILKLKSSLVAEGVHTVARLNARNPLVEYLRECKKKWEKDGSKKRIDTWLATYLGAGGSEDDSEADNARLEEYHKLIGRMWFKGAVARALQPGVKFDYVLILEGHQGLGKSSALAILGGDWAMDTPFSLSDKEGWETLQGTWIVEIAELDAMNKADVRTAKTFFSRKKDRFRLPFARRSAEFLRTCVFAGSTNENEYFRDRTGNRRYLPAHCRRDFSRAELERDRDFLFGEAVAAFEAGERLYFLADEERKVRFEQRRRMRQDPWYGDIARFLKQVEVLKDAEPVTIIRLLKKAVGMEISRADEHGHSTRVGHILAELGYERKENKSIPERYHYVKRPGGHEDDE